MGVDTSEQNVSVQNRCGVASEQSVKCGLEHLNRRFPRINWSVVHQNIASSWIINWGGRASEQRLSHEKLSWGFIRIELLPGEIGVGLHQNRASP